MEQSVLIFLPPAPDEGRLETPEYQEALRELYATAKANGLKPSMRIRGIDAAGGDTPAIITGLSIAGAVLVYVRPLLLEWIKGRTGRTVHLEIGDFKGTARTSKEMGELLDQAEKYQQRKHPKVIL